MVEEEKDKGFSKEVPVTISEIELKVDQANDQQIEKVRFKTKDFDITWKPKHEKITYEGGFKVKSVVPMERGLLPSKLSKMAMMCSELGQIEVKVSYNWWKTETPDGQPVTYRFIQSANMLEKWIVKEVKVEESKVE